MRLAPLAAALCALGAITGATIAHGEGRAPAPRTLPLDAAAAASIDRAVRLQAPAARSQRYRSRTAFRGRIGDAAARRIATRAFGPVATAPLWTQPRLHGGERRVRMLGSRAMVIERNGEPAGVVQSSVPLRNAARRPTDLRLTARGSAFVPRAALAPSRIGKRLRDGVRLPKVGITVTPLMPAKSVAGTLAGARVFYPDAATDTDVIVGAAPAGAAIFYQLRSPRSPGAFELAVSLPRRARLRPARDGRGGIEVVRGDDVIATIEPPVAFDAQGQTVASRYSIEGNRITASVSHRGGDYAYPILLDPVVDQQLWWLDTTPTVTDWFYTTSMPGGFYPSVSGSWGAGIYSVLGGGRMYGNLQYGEWRYPLYGTSFIYRFTFGWEREQTNSQSQAVCMTVGLRNNPGGAWDNAAAWRDGIDNTPTGVGPRTRCHTFNTQALGEGTEFCLISSCAAPATHAPNFAVFQQWTYGAAVRDGWNVSYVGGSVANITDPDSPTIGGGPPATQERTFPWTITYGDAGLGVKTVQLDSPGNADWDQAQSTTFSCLGLNHSRCPASGTLNKTFGNLPAGEQTIRLRVTDLLGRLTTRTWAVFVEGDADEPDSVDPDDPEDPEEPYTTEFTLTDAQRTAALNAITNDLNTQAVLAGREYEIMVGPWTEESPTGEVELVGATAEITLATEASWAMRSWPVISYAGDAEPAVGTYERDTLQASAAHIGVLDLDVDLRTGEVVNLFPAEEPAAMAGEPIPGDPPPPEDPEITIDPDTPVVTPSPEYEGE